MITLRNVTLRRGTRVVLDAASATINPGEKVGLVGRNGAGKSSLFGLLNGELHEDNGDFGMPAQWRMAQVAQEMPETSDPATRFVLEGDTRLLAAQQDVHEAEASGDGERMALAYMALQDAGAHDAEARAQTLILGLGFGLHELDKPVNSFSGGWRMRLQLARALMCPSDLLLLDEPTNHLDLDALVWLEAWLKRYPGTLLVISHDREFLDAVTDVTLHIHQGRLSRYGGNYSRFEDMRAEQLTQQQQAYARQQEKIAHLQRFIDRFKAKATKAKQAQSRVKALERMERIGPVLAEADFTFEFAEPTSLPNPMLALREVDFGYPAGESDAAPLIIVRQVTRSVQAGQRIGILGANGQGKSTVVKTISRVLEPLAGQITEGKGLNIGYFAQQELDVLRPDEHPLQHMLRLARDFESSGRLQGQSTREQDLRNFLGGFQFSGDQVMQEVGSMSGGEKARLVLCMIVWQRPNLLLLDEPTNHLDLATREALSVALNEFEGTVMLVSHDRALLRAVCDEFWLVSRGGISPFDGDLDDYQRYLLDVARQAREGQREELREQRETAPDTRSGTGQPEVGSALRGADQRKRDAARRQAQAERLRPLKKELAQVDKDLASLQQEKTELESRLSQPLPSDELADAGRRLKSVNERIDSLEERWLELGELIEVAGAAD
ncbi:MAG TPA: ATP-binding cassette domain-containing protein [Hydrogenophaga sp.]|uniref:ATP-binding cassette domain-containing protein n=1 Tax=Hydrogenophaga sp. TaxID=1904254 RepID=UPI002CE3C32B|nr:ATP-binding cassette domain-containing protein [Hydrogenophaga sp.]HMN92395.1 ATP-binding cassette domain-containing protein [Hydrogenophaga sp.]HMP10621.1 ATP-binding cassette domain-containing protein [Hydrogenophaga sp.]